MEKMLLEAHAKLNLTMEVLGRRPDGYHDIRSVMQFISLADMVELAEAKEFAFWCDDPALQDDGNLAVRAYRLLATQCKLPPVSIRLYKRVPCMSGMGGGSADAAAVLGGLNQMFGCGLSTQALCDLGKTLGADIPACIVGGALLAQGIGERITPIEAAQPLWFCVIKPEISFSTPAMYKQMDQAGSFAHAYDCAPFVAAVAAGDVPAIAAGLCNSFMSVAQPRQAIDQAIARLLQSGAVGASMTGAGSAVFGIYPSQTAAKAACMALRKQEQSVWLCNGVGQYTVDSKQ